MNTSSSVMGERIQPTLMLTYRYVLNTSLAI